MEDYFSTQASDDHMESPREEAVDPDRMIRLAKVLEGGNIPFQEDELILFHGMFSVMNELTGDVGDEALAQVFMPMVEAMEDEDNISARDKMRAMYRVLEDSPGTKDRLDNKQKLFACFCIYVACSVISEQDDKSHRFIGLPEFVSSDYIKFKMEEYWAVDSYMFTFAL